LLRHSYRRDRTSTISAITVSPRYRRLGLYAHCHHQNITGEEVELFLREVRQHIPGPLVLVWDGGPIHRRALVLDYLRRHAVRLHSRIGVRSPYSAIASDSAA
jgi:hypothetical protein